MMKSETEIKNYINRAYDNYRKKITKKDIKRTALFQSQKGCFLCLSKKDKKEAYHKLMKEFFYKLHNEILDIKSYNYEPPIQTAQPIHKFKTIRY